MRPRRSLRLAAVAVALLGIGAQPAAAAPSRATAADARATAQREHRRVAVREEATQVRKVFANPDGTFTAELFAQAAQVRRDGRWVPVDTRLRRRGDGTLAPRAIAASLTLSGGGAKEPLARLRVRRAAVELRWPGRLPRPLLRGDTAIYRGVLPGVDLRMRVTPQGFAPRIVVRNRRAARRVARIRLGQRMRGARRVFDVGASAVADRGGRRGSATARVAGRTLTVTPDASFMADEKTAYPLSIVPPDYDRAIWESGWAKVMSGNPDSAFWLGGSDGGEAKVGYCGWPSCNGIGTVRSYFQYDHQGFLFGKRILSAQLNAHESYAPSCSARWVDLWQTDPIGGGTTWSNQPWWSRVWLGNHNVAYGYSGACPANWLGFDVSGSVRDRVAAGSGLLTFALAAGDEGDAYAWKKFDWNPSLIVHYNTPPSTPTGLSGADGGCASTPSEPYTFDTTPELRATVSDPDGGLVAAHFEWWNRGGSLVGDTLTDEKSSGSSFTADIPAGAFGDGSKIAWRARGWDGRDWGPFSRWCDLTVDTQLPSDAQVSSTDYPSNEEGGAPGVTGAFTFSATDNTGVRGFRYALGNSEPDQFVAASNGRATVSITPPKTGPQSLFVEAVDRADNPSRNVTEYDFFVGLPTPPAGHWRLDGFDPGTSAPDATGNGRTGTLSGGKWTVGRVKDAVKLNGTSGRVSVSGTPPVATDQSFTVAGWVRLDTAAGWRTAVSVDGNRGSGFYLQWSAELGGWAFSMINSDADNSLGHRAVAAAPQPVGRWTHLAGVYDAGAKQLRLYVDGALAEEVSHTSTWRAGGQLQIGRAKWNGVATDFWPGAVDDVRVYQRALPASELEVLSTQQSADAGRWMLEEGTGTAAGDVSGNYRTATLSGGATWAAGRAGAGAVQLDGATGQLGTSSPAVRTDGSYTVSAWVKADVLGTGVHTALSQDGTRVSGFLLGYRGGTGRWSFMVPGADSTSSPTALASADLSAAPQIGRWTHLTGVLDLAQRSARIYVDGSLKATAPLPSGWKPWYASGPLRIGRAKWNGVAADWWPGAIDDVHLYTGVRTQQQIRAERLRRPPATPYTGSIARFVSHDGDHLTTTGPVPPGYHLEGPLGLPAPAGASGTRTLYLCSRQATDLYTSADAGCDGNPRLGQIGAVYVDRPADLPTRALYRCQVSGGSEWFETLDEGCEGQTRESLLGYVRAYAPLVSNVQPDPPKDQRTSTGGVPATYDAQSAFGLVALSPLAGTQALYSCADGADAFSSLDPACEGKQGLGITAYVWTDPPPDGGIPLVRCRSLDTSGLYDSAEDCGDGTVDQALGYVRTDLSPVPAKPDPGPTVPTSTAPPVLPAAQDDVERVPSTPAVGWPAAASAELAVTDAGSAASTAGLGLSTQAVDGSPVRKVDVSVLGRTADGAGVLVRVRRADGGAAGGPVTLTVDYSRFRNAFGGDWAARLRLVDAGSGKPAPHGHNDVERGTVTARVSASTDGKTYALASAASGSTGDYRATSLSPSGSWHVSEQTGDFAWSEPVGTPPSVPAGFAPSFALTYASGSVDGRVASTNNQASWVGEGWDLGVGFIERRYKSCADDRAATGDLCWKTDNATLSLGGRSTELVKVNDSTWRPKDDDGSRVERLTGAANGALNGEYWRVTTTDGTQHYFGLHRLPGWTTGKPETKSTWTVPVFGNDDGEPCKQATFAASSCMQAWRWNLDYSVDPHGNTIAYYYAPETNLYGLNNGAATRSYTRGGVLLRAEFGTRRGEDYAADAPARIVFDTADRCVSGTTCARTKEAQPDVPWDLNCAAAPCTGRYSPTFWGTKRLVKVRSEVRGAAGYTPLDEWTLAQSFPAPGDGTTASLWLDGVTHTARAGGSLADTPVRFLPSPYANRVDTTTDGLPPMVKFRIGTVHEPSGGEVNIVYDRDCSAGSLPRPEANTTRCFPIRWTPQGGTTRDDWFSKYAVARVTQDDRVGGGALMVTNYEYLGGAAWHYNDDELIADAFRTWSQFRGYARVRVLEGAASGRRSSTVRLYHRGMDGDRLTPTGGTRSVSVTDSEGTPVVDADQLAGVVREELTYDGVRQDGSNGPELTGTIYDARQRLTATQGSLRAYQVDVASERTRTAVSGGERNVRTDYEYNGDGLVTAVDDRGDIATSGDDLCTRTEYARDTARWRLDLESRVQTVAASCSGTPVLPRDAVSETRTYYDGGALGSPPTTGTEARVEALDHFDGDQPAFVTTGRSTYDSYGRATATEDALGRRTTTSFTPSTGRPASMTVTNPKGFRTRMTLDASRGLPTTVRDVDNGRETSLSYDAAGRLTAIWRPGRVKGVDDPNVRHRYSLRDTGTSWVATDTLTPDLGYVTSYALYDGFLRERQTQRPGSGGGRVFTATHYDSRGLVAKATGPEHTTGTPTGDLITILDADAYRQTLTTYDGAERPTVSAFQSRGVEKWRTTTAYTGDSTSVTPPDGGTPTTTFTDARGRVAKLVQYHGGTPSGDGDATRYGYTRDGLLASVTDSSGNRWSYDYDLRGRRIGSVDPDSGARSFTYDNAGQLLSVTDARARTLAYEYDELGRKTAVRSGAADGPALAAWTYDTLAGGKGLPTSSTRYAGGRAYTTEVTGYEAASGRPTGAKVVIPDAETGLGGTYATWFAYRGDGSPDVTTIPALGDLPEETLFHDYDALGLPKSLTSDLADYVTDTAYDWYGQRTQLTLGVEGKEAWHTRYYDNATHRLARGLTQRRLGGTFVNDTTYGYDDAGNVTRITDRFTGDAQEAQCFRYDRLRRLTEAWTSTADCAGSPGSSLGGPAPYWTSFGYDATGNRTSEVRHAAGGDTTRSYSYPAPGTAQPHTVREVTTTGPDGTRTDAYAYDANGDAVSARGQDLTWDDEGHLASMGSSSYVYDADGNRLIRRDATGKTLYLASGEVRYTTATDSTSGTRYYRHGGETVAVRTSAGARYLIDDHHATDEVSIDASTLVATKRRSDPFGNPRGAQPPWPGSHGFVGGVMDPTGLTHLGAREYDPTLGRFISADPIVDPSDPQQLNGYAYANNSPATFWDPDGLIISSRCPDGECRFGGYKPNQSPAYRFGQSRTFRNGAGARCPDGAAYCRVARGNYHAPRLATVNPPVAAPRSSTKQRWINSGIGFADGFVPFGRELRHATGWDRRLFGDAFTVDESSLEYQIGGAVGAIAMTAATSGAGGQLAASRAVSAAASGATFSRGTRFVTTPRGTTFDIPKGWVSRPADNGKGIVFRRPGATGNADMIRIMEPTAQYPNGYFRYYNERGQPLDINGRPGPPSATHHHEDYQGPLGGWPR